MIRNANKGTPEGVYEGASTTDGSRDSLAFSGSLLQYLARKTENVNGEPLNLDERFLADLNSDELATYLDDIDAMSMEQLKEQLPKAQEALDALESKLEELMGLRDATLVSAAAMAARLSALKQADSLYDPIVNGQHASRGHEVMSYRSPNKA